MSTRKINPNESYGSLKIVKYVSSKQAWKCICICETIVYRNATALLKQTHPSCGCKRNTQNTLPDKLSLKREIYRTYKSNAKKRGIKFLLSEKDFTDYYLIRNCHYCGSAPKNVVATRNRPGRKKQKPLFYQGIDRIYNDEGYTLQNCVPCCKICNTSKNNMKLEDWVNWIKDVYNTTYKSWKEDIDYDSTFTDYPERE